MKTKSKLTPSFKPRKPRKPTVHISVRGGVAWMTRKSKNIRVVITDWDNDPDKGSKDIYA